MAGAAAVLRGVIVEKTKTGLIREQVMWEVSHFTPSALVEKWAGVVNSAKAIRAKHPLKKKIHERNWRA